MKIARLIFLVIVGALPAFLSFQISPSKNSQLADFENLRAGVGVETTAKAAGAFDDITVIYSPATPSIAFDNSQESFKNVQGDVSKNYWMFYGGSSLCSLAAPWPCGLTPAVEDRS